MKILKALVASIILSSCASINKSYADETDPSVVSQIDLQKYSGKWYEIARKPTFFQRNCIRSTAEYQVIDDSSVSVYNVCYKADNSTSDIKGTAKIVDRNVPAKLKVKFNIFAQGEYWVTELDPNYQWAVVSASKKSSLFILAREAPMKPELLKSILDTLKAKNFDLTDLVYDQY
ncbi:lipocalin family protein [bacterium]|nr:lipocalin family protein [bacterium]